MRIRIRRNWLGKFYVYLDSDNTHSYYGHSTYLIGKGNHLKLYDNNDRQVLYIKEGYIGTFKNVNKTSYIIEILNEKISIELKCLDYQNGEWTFNKGQEQYKLILRPGQKSALIKEDIIIANYVEDNDENVTITTNDDQDVLLLTSLNLAFKISND